MFKQEEYKSTKIQNIIIQKSSYQKCLLGFSSIFFYDVLKKLVRL